jgi:hypothetical protein
MLPIRRVLARALHERTAPSRLSRARTARVVACALSGLGVWGTLARSAEAQSGRSASSDSARISLTLRDLPLQVALERLVAASGISLQYDTRVLRARAADPPRISCRVERQPAEAMLGCIVQEAGLDFYRLSTGTYVVIARAEEAPAYATLSGIVVDAANGSPLPAARIALAERPDVRVANDAGSFAFGRLAPGSYRLTVQAIGYEPYRRDVVVPADGRVRERILLNRYAVMTTPIVVNGLQPGAASSTLGGVAFTGNVTTPLILGPGLFMPGAPSALGLTRRDGVGDLHIQGGEAGEHVWRLDGVPIFDAAMLAGVFGAFSPLAIDELRVRRAGYEARSGSFTAGVIDLAHGFGDATISRGLQSAAQADPFSASARLVIPARLRGTRITTMLSARTGLWDVYQPNALADAIRAWNVPDPVLLGRLTSIGRTLASGLSNTSRPYTVESGTTDVRLQDFHVASRAEIGAFQRVTASLYVGRHGVATTTEARPLLSPLEQSSTAIIATTQQQSTLASDAYAWRTVAAQVRHEQLHGARVSHLLQLRASEHALDHDFALRIGASPLNQDPPRRDGNRVREFALVSGLQVAGGGAWNLDFGTDLAFTEALLDLRNGVLRALASDEAAWRVSGHAEVQRRLGGRHWLEAGMRITQLLDAGRAYLEPRVTLRADGESQSLGPWAWRVGGGVYRQFVNQFDVATSNPTALVPSVRFWLPAGGRDDVATAYHLAAEGVVTPGGAWQLRGELYGKWQPTIMAFDYGVLLNRDTLLPIALPPSTYVASARGEAYGVGVRAIRDGYVGWTGWSDRSRGLPVRVEAGYDFGVSRRTFPSRFEGRLQPTPWNEPHRALVSIEARPGDGWLLAVRSRGTWGRTWALRQSYYDLLSVGDLGNGLPVTAPGDAPRPAILETDVGLTWTTRVGPWRAEFGAAVQNVFNRRNVLDYSLFRPIDVASEAAFDQVARYLPGAMPSLSLRLHP